MSATVPRLVVEVFEHTNYRGRSGTILEPIRFTRDIAFQDNISSVKVYRGPAFASAPNQKVILWEHRDYRGRKLALGPGFYPNLHDVGYSFPDRISSINFGSDLNSSGPEWGAVPVVVEVYPQPGFQGRKGVILRDIAFTQDIGMQDNIQSFRILKGPDFPRDGCKVIFYEHIDFQGASLPIDVMARDAVIEVPDMRALPERFEAKISSVRIEGWTGSSEFSEAVFYDEFDEHELHRRWEWRDPRGHGQWTENQGYMQMNVAAGVDLWHGQNFDAPRLLQRIDGDFAVETRMPVTSQLKEHGGLIVWKDRGAFVRLEKTSGPHSFNGDVRFERHFPGGYQLVGRGAGLKNAKHLYLRLERRGNRFTGYASDDAVRWLSCGETVQGMRDPVHVGLHALCPGSIPPTETRFDYIGIFRRPHEASHYRRRDGRRWAQTPQLSTLTALRRIAR
ncbi:hypothetical protein HN371_28920 [Candidatus Poribacteria bacterium]|jgi:hypothetical protein|nr:hypothetical protein [Candidatus Poribacteria bacterium]MBT5532261.1 hypothetical protein [Candidatus Poribacteria bacterium]MBT7097759.1 hypothetical protein [Candidatus Poribacteria bacterium]MBT7806190.1 hypothetical protein [Candidatus Poribacteria bacterium]